MKAPTTFREALGPAHEMARHYIESHGIEQFATIVAQWDHPWQPDAQTRDIIRNAAEAFKAQHGRYPFNLAHFGIFEPEPQQLRLF